MAEWGYPPGNQNHALIVRYITEQVSKELAEENQIRRCHYHLRGHSEVLGELTVMHS